MSLKQFLKPNWRKIIIFVILFAIIPLPARFCKDPPSCIDPSGCCWIFIPFGNLLSLSIILSVGVGGDLITIIFMLITIIISYLLSCIIVWIYYKVKKK